MSSRRLRTQVPASADFNSGTFRAPLAHDAQNPAPQSISTSVLEQINASQNVLSGDGKLTTIDVVNDQRFLLMSWIYSVARVIPHTAYLSSPLASPASLLGYTFYMFYGLLYHMDLSLRQGTSIHARLIADDYIFSSLFNRLLDFPVPDFAHVEFLANMPFLPDGNTSLVFIASLASSSFFHDFGRLFPTTMFFSLHNMMASLPANTATGNLRNMFYRTGIMSVMINGANVALTPAHFLGRLINEQANSNWLNSRFDQLVNAMAIRVSNQMAQIGQIPFPDLALANLDAADFLSFYNVFAGNDQAHISSIESALASLAPWIKSTLPNSRPLRDYLRAGSHQITDYLSFSVPMPTWTTETIAAPPDPLVAGQFAPNVRSRTPAEIATRCHFLVDPPAVPAAEDHANGIFEIEHIDPAPSDGTQNVSLRSFVARPVPFPADIQYVHFDTRTHYTPDASIVSIVPTTRESLGHTCITGHVIETYDNLSGTVPFPNHNQSFYVQNSQFLSGALPLRHVHVALFDNVAANAWIIQNYALPHEDSTHQVILRGSSHGLRVPYFAEGMVQLAAAVVDQIRSLPGAEIVRNAVRAFPALNVFGTTPGQTSPLPADARFRLWSSYRFIVPVQLPQDANAVDNIYMLPTLRHIGGTILPIRGTAHPSRRVPL